MLTVNVKDFRAVLLSKSDMDLVYIRYDDSYWYKLEQFHVYLLHDLKIKATDLDFVLLLLICLLFNEN